MYWPIMGRSLEWARKNIDKMKSNIFNIERIYYIKHGTHAIIHLTPLYDFSSNDDEDNITNLICEVVNMFEF